MSAGYQALREGAAWLDLDSRGRIRLTGEDRVRLLHAMCTNHIQQMKPRDTCYTFFLNAQGRILADATVICLDDSLLLDTEPAFHEALFTHLDKYIIADDVTLTDERADWSAIGVEGPKASETLSALPASILQAPVTCTGSAGGRIFVPRAQCDATIGLLQATAASPEDAEIVRLENARPRYGADFTEKNLTHETQLLHAISFSKGCYLGQEIVERVRSRGQVHKLLVPISIESAEPPSPATPVMAGDAQAGETMSAAYSPALQRTVAFAFLRAEQAKPGASLTVAGAPATVTAPMGR
ncbi:MAG: folate-binding protein YgfZ [Acidobacteria bacterium]|nr:folate-binding protein YgfZ [Acidobacteriota bacterium]